MTLNNVISRSIFLYDIYVILHLKLNSTKFQLSTDRYLDIRNIERYKRSISWPKRHARISWEGPLWLLPSSGGAGDTENRPFRSSSLPLSEVNLQEVARKPTMLLHFGWLVFWASSIVTFFGDLYCPSNQIIKVRYWKHITTGFIYLSKCRYLHIYVT